MTAAVLDELANRYGIALDYHDVRGDRIVASSTAKRRMLAALGVAADTDGELRAALTNAPAKSSAKLTAPRGAKCFMPDWLQEGKTWGIALQLYQLRSGRDWGIGDFADLAAFAHDAAAVGADFVGLNPLHALFPAAPDRSSPFSPSNRRFLNTIYIAPDRVPGFDMAEVEPPTLETVRRSGLVDYESVFRLKHSVLRRIWTRWQSDQVKDQGPYTRRSFRDFRAAEGAPLENHARFDALSAEMVARGAGAGWLGWPEEFRHPESDAVAAFAAAHESAISFHAWLQWLADVQLGEAARLARAAGMRIGLYLDLAVGEASDGSATWSDSTLIVPGARIGAPPDYFNEAGQDWGLAPLSPAALRERAIAPYREIMARVMRHAGALRIDHAMGLYQLFVIPDELPAQDGIYLRYPMREMLEVLAAQSHHSGTIVIGEDLGTVPKGFRRVMGACEIQSYRILYFEHSGKRLRAPARYPQKALACLSTHDLPTLQGWWTGDDIALRRRFGFIDGPSAERQASDRAVERHSLLQAVRPGWRPARRRRAPAHSAYPPLDDELAADIHEHLAQAPSRLFAVRLEDLAGEREPVNVPSTTDEYPNWRRRLPTDISALVQSPRYRAIARAVAAVRPRR